MRKDNLPEGMNRVKLNEIAYALRCSELQWQFDLAELVRKWAEQIPSGFCEHGEDIDKWCFGCDFTA